MRSPRRPPPSEWTNAADVRAAQAEDVPRIAEIHVRSWRAAYRGILPDETLDGLSVPERERAWRGLIALGKGRMTLVAEHAPGKVCAFCSVAMPPRGPGTGEAAEIGALYVDPGSWRQGAGSALLKFALRELTARGWHEAVLWVLPENLPALAFYKRTGFEIEPGAEKREERSGRPVIRLRVALPAEKLS